MPCPLCIQHNDLPDLIPELARRADEWGYQRLWLGEHHTSPGIGDPVITTAAAAASSSRIRVGPAGVMLRARNCYRLAEDFDQLERMFPGRIDLGIVRSLPTDDLLTKLLDGRTERDLAEFEDLARQLNAMIHGESDMGLVPIPFTASTQPELWNCGFSERSARLAASIGAGFAFHQYFWRQQQVGGWSDERWESVLETYRREFQPNRRRAEPRVVVALFGMCAETEAKARRHWDAKVAADKDDEKPVLEPDFLGTPTQCVDMIDRVRADLDADELVIRCFTDDPSALLWAYAAIADRAFNA
ncbi:MAG: LLM class flavin-dependent oxidoreductase [Planctomycetota bacterium]|nr:LLM class flavin-dependent oxidoreductase [Planctomycetota bacterium]